jgi:hypothetical protein
VVGARYEKVVELGVFDAMHVKGSVFTRDVVWEEGTAYISHADGRDIGMNVSVDTRTEEMWHVNAAWIVSAFAQNVNGPLGNIIYADTLGLDDNRLVE